MFNFIYGTIYFSIIYYDYSCIWNYIFYYLHVKYNLNSIIYIYIYYRIGMYFLVRPQKFTWPNIMESIKSADI